MLTIRSAQWPADVAALTALDTSVVTDRIYMLYQQDLAFRLAAQPIAPPLRKQYDFRPDDVEERQLWDTTVLAEEAGTLAGFAAAQYCAWNRRVVLWHLYVTPSYRRLGVGTLLLKAIDAFALSRQARCLWIETQNINYPAIQFYLRSGFRFCGLDTSLYDPQSLATEEIALFFTRPVSLRTTNGSDSLEANKG